MRDFFLHIPTRLHFGRRSLAKAGRICASLGHTRLLLLTGGGSCRRSGALDALAAGLEKQGIAWQECAGITATPDLEQVERICRQAQDFQPHALFALGGGAVIDAGKLAAAVLGTKAPLLELLEAGRDILSAVPLYAASTLSGSGSEMNAEAVARSGQACELRGLKGPALQPAAAFVDPALQADLPWELTRRGAVDTFCHIMERYAPGAEAELPCALAEALLRSVLQHAATLRHSPQAYAPRSELCWAAMLAQSGALLSPFGPGDWTVHVLAHALTAHAPHVAHGDAVAALLPAWLELLEELQPGVLARWSREVLGEDSPAAGAARLRLLFQNWGAPLSAAELGLAPEQVAAAVHTATAQGARHGGLGRAAPMQEHVAQLYGRALAD